ncbi:MAG: AtpZ/AtpI family protein [Firmicutes bacterium]|nr:AtpZ/AtpI family protein [Bacillota bacterium]
MKDYRAVRYVALAFTFGTTTAAAILLGLYGGGYLDRRLGTEPYLTLVGIVLGIIVAFRNLFYQLERLEKGPGDQG